MVVEARSENHRFFDVRVQLPENAAFLETDIVKQVKRIALRGKIKISVTSECQKAPSLEIDFKAAQAALSSLKTLKNKLRLKGDITVDHILSFGDLTNKTVKEKKPDRKETARIKQAAAKAIEKLDESKTLEGKRLHKELTLRISKCGRILEKIRTKRKKSEKEMRVKLEGKAKSLFKNKDMDEAKLYQEIAAMSEKSDITEEIVRMNSHLLRFSEFLSESNLSVGKELDFLTQEMNREAGTVSAKSKSPGISHLTIDLRSEIEKMREQVQNVE